MVPTQKTVSTFTILMRLRMPVIRLAGRISIVSSPIRSL